MGYDVSEQNRPVATVDAGYYEQITATRWGRYITGIEREVILDAHRQAGAPSVLLDVGAAGGRWSEMLCALGWRAICTDVNESSLAICQSRLPDATCILVGGDDETLPGADASLRLVLCMEVFGVMPTDWFMAEVARVLEPGGLLVGVFNNRCSMRGTLKHAVHRMKGSLGLDYYGTCYGPWKIRLRSKGFEMTREEGMAWMPFSRSSDSPLVTPFVALERHLGLGQLPAHSPWIAFIARKSASG